MEPFEIMVSESQERMLAIVRPDRLEPVLAVCRRWGLPAAVIGRVTDDGLITIVTGGVDGAGRPTTGSRVLASIPAVALTSDAIVHERVGRPPEIRRSAPAPGSPEMASDGLPERGTDPGAVLQALLGDPNLASRAWVTRQYDATVGTDTVEASERAAGVLRVKGTSKALVMATDANARVGRLDPWLGAAVAVAECARNIAITGARPLGVTNCLNYGSPERPEAFWELQEGVRGIGDACRALDLPVTGGNVSLYNESLAGSIAPTAQIGIVGLLDDISLLVRPAFRGAGDEVLLLGRTVPGLGGSVYAEIAGGVPDDRPPAVDLAAEKALLDLLPAAAAKRLLRSAQDVSGGGLAVALAECALWGGVGADLTVGVLSAPAVELFGEGPGRVVVTVAPGDAPALEALAAAHGVPVRRLGTTGGDRLLIRLAGDGATGAAEGRGATVADRLDAPLPVLRDAWERGLARALGEDDPVAPSASEER
jgi:phosphoribosylformylglycinamidine synthase